MILGKMLLPAPGTTLKNGLVSCWEFDEPSIGTICDLHSQNNLASTGTVTASQAGMTGSAFDFDPGCAYGAARVVTSFPFTVSWWVKPKPSSVNRLATNVSGTPYYGVEIGLDYNQCGVQFGNGGGSGSANRRSFSLSGTVATNVWHLLVVVVTGHGTFAYYLDNVQKTGFSASGTAASTSFASGVPYIGKPWGSSVAYSRSTIDQVGIWNRALTADEIALLYNAGQGLAFAQW